MNERETHAHLSRIIKHPISGLRRGEVRGTYFETINGRWWGYERANGEWILYQSREAYGRFGEFDTLVDARIRALKESRNV